MDLILRGKPYSVTVEQVQQLTQDVDPAPLARYAVRVHNRWYPPKQILSLITGLPVAAFTTQDAYRAMQRLGLEVVEKSAITQEDPS
jgi:hypothetical protein